MEAKQNNENWPPTSCDLCGGNLVKVAQTANYLLGLDNKRVVQLFPLHRCQDCGTLMSEISPMEMTRHLMIASHTDPANIDAHTTMRLKFFEWLYQSFAEEMKPESRPLRVLDFGPAFGVMSQMLVEKGCEVVGVELDDRARDAAREKVPNARFEKRLSDISDLKGYFDVIFAVDSLYLVTSPSATLAAFKEFLAPGGWLVGRVTNRTWYFNLQRLRGKLMMQSPLGDARWGFTRKGLEKAFLTIGLDNIAFYYSEPHKVLSPLKQIAYKISGLVADSTNGMLPFSPGLVFQARKP